MAESLSAFVAKPLAAWRRPWQSGDSRALPDYGEASGTAARHVFANDSAVARWNSDLLVAWQ